MVTTQNNTGFMNRYQYTNISKIGISNLKQ